MAWDSRRRGGTAHQDGAGVGQDEEERVQGIGRLLREGGRGDQRLVGERGRHHVQDLPRGVDLVVVDVIAGQERALEHQQVA
jgi:hypothetical protein